MFFVFGLVGSTLLTAVDLTALDVVNSWKAGCEVIRSYDLTIELEAASFVESTPGGIFHLISDQKNVKPVKTKSRLYRSNEKRRGEFGPALGTLNADILAFNGDSWSNFNAQQKKVTIQHGILAMGSIEYEDYEACYRMLLGSTDRITETMRRDMKLLPREGRLFVLDVAYAKTHQQAFFNFRWRVWLDPDRNFMPVRLRDWHDQAGVDQPFTEVENTIEEVAPGVWAPVSSYMKVYAMGDPKESPLVGQWIGWNRLRVIEPSSFGRDVPAALFTVEIPSGFLVIDEIRNITYTKGSSDPDRYLAQLARNAAEGMAGRPPTPARPTVMQHAPDSWWIKHRGWLAWLAAGVLAIVASVSVIRFRLARRNA